MKALKYAVFACLLTGISTGASSKSFKRGVSENQFQYKAQMEALADGVSWYYNWGNTPSTYISEQDYMEYLPMCWNANFSADKIRAYCKTHPKTKYLLGFNEPNFQAQANMTPQEAAAQWPALRTLADELGLELVAPALNYSPNPPYTDPTRWMDEFVALVGPDAFDYVAVHNYGGFGVMVDLCTKFHERYGKPVWVTEFCYWPEEGNANSTVAPAQQISSMAQCVQWLEQTEWIHRYAWFKAVGNSTASKGPNYGLLKPGKGEEPRELSEQGHVYVHLGTFDKTVWHKINEEIMATDYIEQKLCGIGSGKGSAPIELSAFNGGAWADYQFDVEQPGEYTLVLKVSGIGEPERFNPSIMVGHKEGNNIVKLGELTNISLPNADNVYKELYFPVRLEAGKQMLHIEDMAPYMPSGVRISTLRLADASGVDELASNPQADFKDRNVYNLQGLRVADIDDFDSLPAGIYICEGKKVVKD